MQNIVIFIILVFIIGCGNSSKNESNDSGSIEQIITIREASGICYVEKTDTLFVVGDNGFLYEIDKSGRLLKEKNLNLKDNDFEGIAYDSSSDQLYVAIEGVDNLLVVTRELEYVKEINIDRKDSKNRKILENGGEGLEAIAMIDGEVYLSNQSFKTLPKDDPSVVVKINFELNNTASLTEVINHGYLNISGMTFYDDFLYLLSDSNNSLIKYDINTNETLQTWHIKGDIIDDTLKNVALEGVTFDNGEYIYFAIDDKQDGKIVKMSIKSLDSYKK